MTLAIVFGSLLYAAEALAQHEASVATTVATSTTAAAGDDVTDVNSTEVDRTEVELGFPSGVYRIADGSVVEYDDTDSGLGTGSDYSLLDDQAAVTSISDVNLTSLAFRGPIEPGLYATGFDAEECEYELRRTTSERGEWVIGHDYLGQGRTLVTLNSIEPDVFVATSGCGRWVPWTPLVVPLTQAGDGDYWVGDLEPGIWEVPDGCYWEKVASFRGADLADVMDSGTGPDPLVVDEGTLGVRIRTCNRTDMVRVDEASPYVPPPTRSRTYGEEVG